MTRDKYSTPNGLLQAARECGLNESSFHQLPGYRVPKLLDRILDTFTNEGRGGRKRRWIWEDLREPNLFLMGRQQITLLNALGSPETPVWFIAEDFGRAKEGPPFWLFEATLGAVSAVLDNHHLIEFCVASRSLMWLIGENHHDIWFASGEHAVATFQRHMGKESCQSLRQPPTT